MFFSQKVGIPLDPRGRIVVNERFQTNVPRLVRCLFYVQSVVAVFVICSRWAGYSAHQIVTERFYASHWDRYVFQRALFSVKLFRFVLLFQYIRYR